MEILYHHWDTYRKLSIQDGEPEELAKKQVDSLQSIREYKLNNPSNRERREQAVAEVIQAFRGGDVEMIEDGIGVMDRICESCAADDCSAKPNHNHSFTLLSKRFFAKIKSL